MASHIAIRLDYEDFAAIPHDGRRHEIIDGEHCVNPAPNLRHQAILLNLAIALRLHVEPSGIGSVFVAPTDVILTDYDVVQPDLIFVSSGRARILTPDNIQGVPDLLIEILSPGNRRYDKRIKFETYQRVGVPEYWIVDPEDEVIEVYRHDGATFQRVPSGEAVTSPLLPGFSLPLRDVFA